MERSTTPNSFSIEEEVFNVEELIKMTRKSVVDLENLRNEYHGFMPDMVREEYDELKKRLQKLRQIHFKLKSSSNISWDSNDVSPRKTLVEVTELSSNLNEDSLTNLKHVDRNYLDKFPNQQIPHNKRPIICQTAYNRVSHSLDYDQNNGWVEHKNISMRELEEADGFAPDTSHIGKDLNGDIGNKFTSMNLSTREFVVIQIPPKLTYKLRVSTQEDMYSLVMPYLRNLNINADNTQRSIINLNVSSMEYSKKILKVYYKSITNKITPKFHILSKKFFVATKNCIICKSRIINGLKCSQCLLTFHKKCYCKKPTLCDPKPSDNDTSNNQLGSNHHRIEDVQRKSESSKAEVIKSQIIYPNLLNFQFNDNQHLGLNAKSQNCVLSTMNNSFDEHTPNFNTTRQVPNYCTLNKKIRQPNSQNLYKNITSCQQINSSYNHKSNNVNCERKSWNETSKYYEPSFAKNDTLNESELFEEYNTNSVDQENTANNHNYPSNDDKSYPYHSSRPRRRVVRVKPVTDNLHLPWYIENGEVDIQQKIGVGSFGTVYKGFWHGNVAVKFLNVVSPNEEQLISFKNEVNILRKTRHNNILLFVGCIYAPRLAIVTQWCDGSSLYNFLHVDEQRFKLPQLVNIAIQTCDGMDYLHAKNIIHRDLKSNNLFLQNSIVKIGDFGLSTVKRRGFSEFSNKQPTGSILWMAPEVIRMDSSDPYTVFSDVYSFGIVLFELLSCKLPYSHIKFKDQILYMVGKGKLQPDTSQLQTQYGSFLKTLYHNCIMFKPSDRPLFSTVASNLKTYKDKLPKISRTTSTKEYRYSLGSRICSFDDEIM